MGRGDAIPNPMPKTCELHGRVSSGGDSRMGPGSSGLVWCLRSGKVAGDMVGEQRGDGCTEGSLEAFWRGVVGDGGGESESAGGGGRGGTEAEVDWVNMNCRGNKKDNRIPM